MHQSNTIISEIQEVNLTKMNFDTDGLDGGIFSMIHKIFGLRTADPKRLRSIFTKYLKCFLKFIFMFMFTMTIQMGLQYIYIHD